MTTLCKRNVCTENGERIDERTTTGMARVSFAALPDNIVRVILSMACTKEEDINRMAQVCRKWLEHTTHASVWRNVEDRCEFTGARFHETIFTWGHERFGVLGSIPIANEAVPNPIEMNFFRGRRVRKIGCGGFYASVLLDNGTFYVVGDNTFCQHGTAAIPKEHVAPTKLALGSDSERATPFVSVSNGYAYMLGLRQEEAVYYDDSGRLQTTTGLSLWGWGTGHFGTMLDGEFRDAVPARKMLETRLSEAFENDSFGATGCVPHLPASLNLFRVKKLSCGDSMVVALTDDYHVFSWGSNNGGRLGTEREDTSERFPPELVRKLEGKRIIKIACGGGHSLALSEEGRVYSWGSGGVGATAGATLDVTGGAARLGHGEHPPFCSTDRRGHLYLNRPMRIRGVTERATHISCGQWHSLVLLENGHILVFGGNSFGQLGIGHERTVFVPTVSPFLSFLNARKVVGGRLHSGALTRDGRVFTWGCGLDGQLGNGKLTNSCMPVLARIPERFFATKLAIGKFQTMVAVRLRCESDNDTNVDGTPVAVGFRAATMSPSWGDDLPSNGSRIERTLARSDVGTEFPSVTMTLPLNTPPLRLRSPHLHVLRSTISPRSVRAPVLQPPSLVLQPTEMTAVASPTAITGDRETSAVQVGSAFTEPSRSSVMLSAITRHRRHQSLGAVSKKTASPSASPSPSLLIGSPSRRMRGSSLSPSTSSSMTHSSQESEDQAM